MSTQLVWVRLTLLCLEGKCQSENVAVMEWHISYKKKDKLTSVVPWQTLLCLVCFSWQSFWQPLVIEFPSKKHIVHSQDKKCPRPSFIWEIWLGNDTKQSAGEKIYNYTGVAGTSKGCTVVLQNEVLPSQKVFGRQQIPTWREHYNQTTNKYNAGLIIRSLTVLIILISFSLSFNHAQIHLNTDPYDQQRTSLPGRNFNLLYFLVTHIHHHKFELHQVTFSELKNNS